MAKRDGHNIIPVSYTHLFDVESSIDEALLAEKCRQRGVLFNPTPERIRLVTHRDVSFEDVEKAAKVIGEELCQLR